MTGDLTDVNLLDVVQGGFVGFVLVCMMVRKFFVPEWTLKKAEDEAADEKAQLTTRFADEKAELTKRLDDAHDQVARFQAVFEQQVIPTLAKATDVNALYTEELQYARFSGRTRPTPPTRTTSDDR